MDRNSIIVLVVCFVLLMLWYPLVVNKLYPPKPMPRGTNAPATMVTGTNQGGMVTNVPVLAEAPTNAPRVILNTNVPEEFVMITNENARYTFTSHGGGLKLVELLKYPETVSTRRQKQPQTNRVATLNTVTPAPTLAILDGEAIQGDGIFKLSKTDESTVRAEKTLANGLTIVKNFELSTNYLVTATVKVENHSGQALTLPQQEWVVGTATPMGARDDGSAVAVNWYNGAKTAGDIGTATYFSSKGFMCNTKRDIDVPREYRGGASNVFWAAAHNQFFALALMPPEAAQSLVVRRIDLPRPTGEEAKYVSMSGPPPQGYEAALIYPPLTLTNNQTMERQVFLYAGPKEYRTLATIADRFNNNLDQLMGFNWSGFVSKALLLGMNWMHNGLKLSYGWAIVAITTLIKLIFWPLTQASTRSMKRMQALQPEIKKLQEKYKDDPTKLSQKQLEFWRKNKINPMAGCLPMLLQVPVFFGFYSMIRSAIELRGAPFLWVGDLSKPDTLFMIPGLGFIPFVGVAGQGLPFNLLPLLMGATMFWQAHLTPPSPGMEPTQQAIMKYLPLMFLVGLYNFSAGMTLYWTVNNLLTIAQTKLTRTTTAPTPPTGPAPPAKAPVLTPPQKKRK
jgi:YidC/Oxa1 family membrane protein insertase